MTELVARVGAALGGEAGARLLPVLGTTASVDTVLREVHRAQTPTIAAPRVIGVDEWAWRKGHTYGTILVDLERRKPIALLPERSSESFAAWLREHPSVEVIACDRSEIYADGARRGWSRRRPGGRSLASGTCSRTSATCWSVSCTVIARSWRK